MILLALVDSSYRFIMVDVGAYRRNSDGGVLQTSQFGQAFADGRLNIPAPSALPGAPDRDEMPHVFVGDEAFPLQANLMRPYPGQPGRFPLEKANFNYRLSRARRVVENAFGILASRWRIYERRINLNEENTQKVVLATCILHNFLQTKSTPLPIPAIADEAAARLRQGLQPLGNFGIRPRNQAMAIRDQFATYFTDRNALHWQEQHVQRGLNVWIGPSSIPISCITSTSEVKLNKYYYVLSLFSVI